MSGRPPFYITTPIYYVNDSPHIGHAYTTLACDVMARFKRLDGFDVKFLTGTDEHGQKVEKSAQARGMDPQAFTDMVSANFRDLAAALNFSHDDFHPHHRGPPHPRLSGPVGDPVGTRARSIWTAMPAGTRCATRRSTARTN